MLCALCAIQVIKYCLTALVADVVIASFVAELEASVEPRFGDNRRRGHLAQANGQKTRPELRGRWGVTEAQGADTRGRRSHANAEALHANSGMWM